MKRITDLRFLPFVAADPEIYEDAWYEVEDTRRTFTDEEAERVEAFFAGMVAEQVAAAEELVGWITPGFDSAGAFQAVVLDRLHHLAVYIRKDGSREVKPIPEFVDDPFTPPPDSRLRVMRVSAPPMVHRLQLMRKQLGLN